MIHNVEKKRIVNVSKKKVTMKGVNNCSWKGKEKYRKIIDKKCKIKKNWPKITRNGFVDNKKWSREGRKGKRKKGRKRRREQNDKWRKKLKTRKKNIENKSKQEDKI